MFEKIIVPLDGSKLAEVALPYAEELAGRLEAKLIIISVREPHESISQHLNECYLEQMAGIAKTGAESYLGEGVPKLITAETKILQGSAAEEVVSFAERTEGALLVMATHGHSGITRWALGSVADKVTHAAVNPVLVIRAKGSEPAVRPKVIITKILAPLDGSRESETSLPYVTELAKKLDAQVVLLRVLKFDYLVSGLEQIEMLDSIRKQAQEYMSKAADSLKAKNIEVSYEIRETRDDEAAEIIQYTRDNYADLLVMATHGRAGPKRWILGSITNRLLRLGNTPLMLVRTLGEYRD